MLNLIFTFLQLNKKTLFTQSTLQIYQINECKSIVLIKILALIKKEKKMIDLKDFGLPESPRSKEEQLCVNYGCEERGRRKLWL